ncbi:MAG: hypothetical protein K2X86_16580 [Cytophagaceae bacterium]|nr:hypothetical protein [Cytophagaceae bacterium]
MKKKFFLIVIIYGYICTVVSGQIEVWTKTAGGAGDDEAKAVASDSLGNIYVTGFFKSCSLTLGEEILQNESEEYSDVFLAKYDVTGKMRWAVSAGGLKDDEPLGISLDKSGNIYVRGCFESDFMYLGDVALENHDVGNLSMFLAKYDSSGKLLWAKSAEVLPVSHYVDGQENVYVTGEFFRGVNIFFDKVRFVPASDGLFMIKYDSNGEILWLKKGTGGLPFAISGDKNDNIYLTGIITPPEGTFENIYMSNKMTQGKSTDMFIMKFNERGKLLWKKVVGGKGDEYPRAQHVSAAGEFYIVMKYSSLDFKVEKASYRNGGGDDLLLIKYSSSGKILWAKKAGGAGHDNPVFMTCDHKENIYIVGHYYSDKICFDQLTLQNVGLNDIFIAKFSPDSELLWAKTTGGCHHDYPSGLVVDASENLYLLGVFNSNGNTGNDKIVTEFFIEKYDPAGDMIWKSAQKRTDEFDFAFGECMDNSGNLFMVGYFAGNIKYADDNIKSNGSKDLFILKCNVKNK